ncbi:unnamed protein product, partial [Brassica oleracea]
MANLISWYQDRHELASLCFNLQVATYTVDYFVFTCIDFASTVYKCRLIYMLDS